MDTQEIISTIALTKLKGLGLLNARTLMDTLGSATEVFAHRKDIVSLIPDASQRLIAALADTGSALKTAEEEMEFIEAKHLKALTLNDENYPQRLKECEDAPLVLYSCGTADLNSQRIISIVGTRKCSGYGREVCENFTTACPPLACWHMDWTPSIPPCTEKQLLTWCISKEDC